MPKPSATHTNTDWHSTTDPPRSSRSAPVLGGNVVTGDNSVLWPTRVFTGYNAGPGWDPVTSWGSPNAQYLVPLLRRRGPLRASH